MMASPIHGSTRNRWRFIIFEMLWCSKVKWEKNKITFIPDNFKAQYVVIKFWKKNYIWRKNTIKGGKRMFQTIQAQSILGWATGIGRTGRVGNVGKATSFYDDKVDRNLAADLVKHSYRKTHEAILKYVTL